MLRGARVGLVYMDGKRGRGGMGMEMEIVRYVDIVGEIDQIEGGGR